MEGSFPFCFALSVYGRFCWFSQFISRQTNAVQSFLSAPNSMAAILARRLEFCLQTSAKLSFAFTNFSYCTAYGSCCPTLEIASIHIFLLGNKNWHKCVVREGFERPKHQGTTSRPCIFCEEVLCISNTSKKKVNPCSFVCTPCTVISRKTKNTRKNKQICNSIYITF